MKQSSASQGMSPTSKQAVEQCNSKNIVSYCCQEKLGRKRRKIGAYTRVSSTSSSSARIKITNKVPSCGSNSLGSYKNRPNSNPRILLHPVILIRQREIGLSGYRYWQRHSPLSLAPLLRGTEAPEDWTSLMTKPIENKKAWRKYCYRSIKFSSLCTPVTDAVLALDRTGSFMISLSDGREEMSLLLRFYGVPGPSAIFINEFGGIRRRTRSLRVVSPLLLTVPLLLPQTETNGNPFEYRSNDLATTTPVQIITSSDSVLGVAFVHHSLSPENDDALSTIVMFPLPSFSSQKLKTYMCSNIRAQACMTTPTICNLLWPTGVVPYRHMDSSSSLEWMDVFPKAYIFLNDEDDGFRITWMSAFTTTTNISSSLMKRFHVCTRGKNIFTVPENVAWETVHSDPIQGNVYQTSAMPQCAFGDCDKNNSSVANEAAEELNIVFEAYLCIEALLHDIVTRRPNLFPGNRGTLPDFHYNLVSITDQGRTAVFILVFASNTNQTASRKKPSSLGVFICIDLLGESYDEMKWVQHPSQSNSQFLRKWSNELCVWYRMQEMGFDEFTACQKSVEAGYNKDSLYPYCDFIQNNAVTAGQPVARLSCQAPIEIFYE